MKDICRRYGQHYNNGSLPRQFGQVVWRILRHAFPSKPRRLPMSDIMSAPASANAG